MLERFIRGIAGTFVLLSLGLGYLYSPYWHLFTAFVGANLLQSAFTRWCPMEALLARLGVTPHAPAPERPHRSPAPPGEPAVATGSGSEL
ncbi:MAG: DUF2892 domain-containing protein [Planctomycetes bacterium]|nr:DUF2892 domain-containing protein [Planctomycetota bacterium]